MFIDRKKYPETDFSYEVMRSASGLRYMQIVHIPSQWGRNIIMREGKTWGVSDILLCAAWYRDKIILALEVNGVRW